MAGAVNERDELTAYRLAKASVEDSGGAAFDPDVSTALRLFGRTGRARFVDLANLAARPHPPDQTGATYVRSNNDALEAVCRFLHIHVVNNSALYDAAPRFAPIVVMLRHNRLRGFLLRSDMSAYLRRAMRLRGGVRHRGGAFLGRGREGTRVYTMGDIPGLYGDRGVATCVVPFSSLEAPACVRSVSEAVAVVGGDECCVKDIPDASDALLESAINRRLHGWFVAARKLGSTPLHPRFCHVDIAPSKKRLLLYLTMQGDLSTMTRARARDVGTVATAVLQALSVLHANRAVHLDVKPQNVLISRAPDRVVLADYGLVASTSAVLVNALRGGSPSGTDGFISPLVIREDDENNVYPRFATVAAAVDLKDAPHNAAGWRRFFDKHSVRREADVYKADLHSVALTLLEIMRLNRLDLQEHPAIARFVGRLMFFRRGDFTAAKTAAVAAKKLVAASKTPSKRSVRLF